MKRGGGVLVGAEGENVVDLIVGAKKPLHLPWRLEPFHSPLASSRRLVGILRSVVQGPCAAECARSIAGWKPLLPLPVFETRLVVNIRAPGTTLHY
jgi:hypothetical protein